MCTGNSKIKLKITIQTPHHNLRSAGVIINEILTRERPYANRQSCPEHIFHEVCTVDLRPQMQPLSRDDFTEGMTSIVSDCLQRNAYARPSFTSIAVIKFVSF